MTFEDLITSDKVGIAVTIHVLPPRLWWIIKCEGEESCTVCALHMVDDQIERFKLRPLCGCCLNTYLGRVGVHAIGKLDKRATEMLKSDIQNVFHEDPKRV